mgnify:CR=1 FL=1
MSPLCKSKTINIGPLSRTWLTPGSTLGSGAEPTGDEPLLAASSSRQQRERTQHQKLAFFTQYRSFQWEGGSWWSRDWPIARGWREAATHSFS